MDIVLLLRVALLILAAEFPGICRVMAGDSPSSSTLEPSPVLASQNVTAEGLKGHFAKLFDIGTAANSGLSPAEQMVLLGNFSNVTPEGCMKPKATEPAEGIYTFAQADAFVDFAQEHHIKVNGHCLVWHNSCPDWFFLDGEKPAGRDLVLKRMREHITTEVSRYKGKVFSWDVVNEALDDGPGYLRHTKWETAIGDDYIAQAFLAAHAADPQAELYYNDYNIENPAKREKAIRLIRDLKKQNVAITGIGIQGHWMLDHIPFKNLEDAIVAFHAEGVKVMVTELDLDVVPRKTGTGDAAAKQTAVTDLYPISCPPEILARQADQYKQLFQLFVKHSEAISRVTFWGFYDGRSWLNSWPYKRTNYGLLWDRQLQPKPALAAVLSVVPVGQSGPQVP